MPVLLVSSCASPTLSGPRHLEESEPIIEDRTGSIETLLYECHLQLQGRDTLLAYTAFIGDTPDLHPSALTRVMLATDRDGLVWQTDVSVETVDGGATEGRHDATSESV